VTTLALLLAEPDVRRPERDSKLAPAIIAGYQSLWHPRLLANAAHIPLIQEIANPPAGDDRVFVVPAAVHDAADSIVQNDLVVPGTKIVLVREEVGQDGPHRLSAAAHATDNDPIVQHFFAVGFAYLALEVLLRRLGRPEKLEEDLIWAEVQQAAESYVAGEEDHARAALHAALEVMHGSRQAAYPATINWLTLAIARPENNDDALRNALDQQSSPWNLLITADQARRLRPETLERIKDAVADQKLEIVSGRTTDRPFNYLPLESRLWEIDQSLRTWKEFLSRDLDTFGGRVASLSPDLPQLLMKFNVRHALHLCLDGSTYPRLRGPKIHWTSADGSVVETVARTPDSASDDHTGLSVFANMADTLKNDRSPTGFLVHWLDQRAPWFDAWIRVQADVPVFGKLETVTNYFLNSTLPDAPTVTRIDEYRVANDARGGERPVGRWRDLARRRNRFDVANSLRALAALASSDPMADVPTDDLERAIEVGDTNADSRLMDFEIQAQRILAERILGDAPAGDGYLLVNPSNFPRRATLHLSNLRRDLPLDSALRAIEPTPEGANVIVDLSGWSFAWLPRSTGAEPATAAAIELDPVAQGARLKNTLIDVLVDRKTGGLKSIASVRDGYNRLSQQLVYGGGSRVVGRSFEVSVDQRLVGEITTCGEIQSTDGRSILATFQQRVRVWRGRSVARIDIAIEPRSLPHAADPDGHYFACRWGWPDEKSTILAAHGPAMQSHTGEHVEASHFLEIREQHIATNIVTDGMVRHQRVTHRTADSILWLAGEANARATFWVGVDVPDPFRFAQAETWPIQVIPVLASPPTDDITGTIGRLVGDHVLVNSLRYRSAPARIDLRAAETAGAARRAEISWLRRPVVDASLRSFRDETIYDLYLEGDKVSVDLSAFEWQKVSWTLDETPAIPNSP
jgi:hypothetical protein